MYYVNEKQKEILSIINKFGCVKKQQLEKLTGITNLDYSLLNKNGVTFKDDICLASNKKDVNDKMISALDVYCNVNSSDESVHVEWCELAPFPFILTLFRNGKVFDIAVINEGEEVSYTAAINRSVADRVLIVIKNPIQIEKIKVNKEFRICMIENNEVKFYEI